MLHTCTHGVWVGVGVCVHLWVFVCVCVFVFVHVRLCVSVHPCINACFRVCMFVHTSLFFPRFHSGSHFCCTHTGN